MSLTHALKAIDDLHNAVEQLALNVLPGTALPFTGHLTDDKKREQAALHRQEREEREARWAKARGPFATADPIGGGETPDPYRLDMVELLTHILAKADELADTVSQAAGVNPQPPAASAYESPARFLVHTRAWLDMAEEAQAGLTWKVKDECEALTFRANVLLGHMGDGHRLPHDCPWCGVDQVRIRSIAVTYDDGHEQYRPHIVCESRLCTVNEESVTYWHRGHPAWDLINEGDWFGRCIEAKRAKRECRCGKPLPLTGLAGRPARYCSDDCRRAADAERKRVA